MPRKDDGDKTTIGASAGSTTPFYDPPNLYHRPHIRWKSGVAGIEVPVVLF